MARITVEDCLENVDNRFKLVLTAAKRARQLSEGAAPLVEWENDKPTVVALREIAEGVITDEVLEQMEQEQAAAAAAAEAEAMEDALDAEIRGMFLAAGEAGAAAEAAAGDEQGPPATGEEADEAQED